MPGRPRGKDEFEYEKREQKHKYKSLSSEEGLGDMHLSTENYTVALEYYDKALRMVHSTSSKPADLVRIYRKISDCYRKKGLLREAMAFLQNAQSHCEENDVIGKGTIACRRGIVLYERGELEQALRNASSAYRMLRTGNEHREVAHTQLLIANCYFRFGRNDEAEQYYYDALSSYRRINDSVGESYVLNNLGLFHKNACRWGRALDFLKKSLEICEELGLTQHKVRVILNLGIVNLKRRDFAAAESDFTSARKMARRTGDDLKYARATIMLGVAENCIGNLVSAEKHLLESRVLAERRNYGREIALADEFLGDLIVARGDLTGALENYMAALSGAKKISPEGDIVAEVLRRMAHVRLLQGKPKEVLSIGKRALEIAEKCGEHHEIGFIKRTIGLARAQLGKNYEAEKYMKASIRKFLDVNNPYEANRSNYLMSEHLLKRKERKSLVSARKLMNETLSYFEKSEDYRDLAESHLLLARIERELQSRDECLLHMYEAQRLAEDLKERNLLRRIKRMRKQVENELARPSPVWEFGMSDKRRGLFKKNSHLRSYRDYILGDLMRKLTLGHGFVALCNGNNDKKGVVILARRSISAQTTLELTKWFLSRDDANLSERFLITDTTHDRRSAGIREILPGGRAPVYFHPFCRDREPFGLFFFQADGNGGEPARLGSSFDVVATYAGFIGFLVRGFLGNIEPSRSKREDEKGYFQPIITKNGRMLKVLTLAERVAESDSTVLLMGETGTGKGLVAQAIHRMSLRRDKKFIHVNCAALPDSLLESELFGHIKGAFTGAISDKKGLFAEADGGTIFLDEIGKTSLPLQGKLLQFLDTRNVRPVGSNSMLGVNVRIIFASKVDLLALCRGGKMLEDFYYRINDFPLTIPPLRDRVEDVELLVEHYLRVFCKEMGRGTVAFSNEALSRMAAYEWPGNVRELEKVVKRAVILTDNGGLITPAALGFGFTEGDSSTRSSAMSLPDRVQELEKRVISRVLLQNSWNRRAAATELCISYPTLLKKIRTYHLSEDH